jgi:spore maturation protein CgeB
MLNILYIDSGNALSKDHMYPYYGAIYRELTNLASVTTIQGYVKNIDMLMAQLGKKIDCIIYGLGYFAVQNPVWFGKVEGLPESDIPVIAMLHKPQHLLEEKLNFCRLNKIDILFYPDITCNEYAAQVGAHPIKTWHTADPGIFHPRNVEKEYDIGFSGALHGGNKVKGPAQNIRPRVHEMLLKNGSYKMFWNGSDSIAPRIKNVNEYATYINRSKIWLATSGPCGFIGPRYFEVMMSKTLLICNDMPLQYDNVFVDGENCVIFKNDLSDFIEKIDHYLNNKDDLARVIENGYNLAVGHFTWKHMAIELIEKIKSLSNA